ncbi:vomeronasal type-2 receptor 26-like [Varanus komodoensis]|uniref:vomeronasal type-2 receptor 26-like n=1 Tax=Varanus komodoensis TaxID=61221 RepID=UPI001CF7E5B5|nr:vomeronasal type-2 receptor 26-like [Varanus komodoensis]
MAAKGAFLNRHMHEMNAGGFVHSRKLCFCFCGLSALLVWLLLLPWVCEVDAKRRVSCDPIPIPHESYLSGGFLMGGMVSLISVYFSESSFKECPWQEFTDYITVATHFYQNILSLTFAVTEINRNPGILPNVTLGFHVYDSCNNAQMTYRTMIDLLFRSYRLVPDYNCDAWKRVIAVIGARAFDTSLCMEKILNPFKIPQLTCGLFPSVEQEMTALPLFYRMVPPDIHQYIGTASLLKNFGWTWVGLFIVDSPQGELFLQALETLFFQHGICTEFTRWIQSHYHLYLAKAWNAEAHAMLQLIHLRTSRTFVVYGETFTFIYMWYFICKNGYPGYEQNILAGKLWIMTAQVDFVLASRIKEYDLQAFHGAIAFSIHTNEVLEFQKFLHVLNQIGHI